MKPTLTESARHMGSKYGFMIPIRSDSVVRELPHFHRVPTGEFMLRPSGHCTIEGLIYMTKMARKFQLESKHISLIENRTEFNSFRKNKINMIFERKKEQFMKGDGQGTVVGQAMNDAVAKHSTNKSYINWHGQKWDLLAKIEDEAHFKQIRLNQILHKYNKKTVQLRCPMRHEKYGRCPYHGLYFIGPRLLYHRLVHNHPECEKNGKQVGKGPKMAKKKHNSRTYQQKSGTVEGSINFKDQRSERGDDQRSACQKRKSRSLVPGKSRTKLKKFNC